MGETPGNGETPHVTRRTLLGGAAAVGAATLIGPAAGLAEARQGSRLVSSRWIGSLSGTSAAILAPGRFVLAGVEWSAPPRATIELRARAPSGSWSHWVPASVLGHDADGANRRAGLFGEPAWTGVADAVQVRSNRLVDGVRVHFVALGAQAVRATSVRALATPVLDAGPGQPPILAREAWAGGQARPVHAPTYGTIDLAFVHHTVNPNGYSAAEVPALLVSIFNYHVHVRGFWDIAYNFIIDLYGGIWEGRAGGIDMPVIGAHAGAYNAESTGVAVLGDFMNVVPSAAAIASLERLLAWKLSLHGVPTEGRATVVVDPKSAYYTPFPPGAHVSLPRIAGHRDGDSTDCPGNAFYGQLPAIRPRVTSLAGTAARITAGTPRARLTGGGTVTVSGRLALLSGAPIAGALVEFQQLRGVGTPATLATTQTAVDGSWSVPVTVTEDALVRGLHRSHPAAVSDWLDLAVAPAITLAVASIAPLRVTGTISPAKRRATVALYPARRTTGKPIASKLVRVVAGNFAAGFASVRPGNYVLIARSAADQLNAAGASAHVPVTIS